MAGHETRARTGRTADDDDLDPGQLSAMDKLWHARRDGVPEDEAAAIESLVREGRVHLAFRRIAAARRNLAGHDGRR